MPGSKETFPVLPLRDIVVFPNMIVPLFVGRQKSIVALEEIVGSQKKLVLVAQKKSQDDDPAPDEIYNIGVQANVLQMLKLPDGTVKVLVEGQGTMEIGEYVETTNHLEAYAEPLPISWDDSDEEEVGALVSSIKESFERYAKGRKNVHDETIAEVADIDDPMKLAYVVAGNLALAVEKKQKVLEILSVSKCLEKVFALVQDEVSMMRVEKKIKNRVKSQLEKTQKEIYLNEQMKAIQKELGDKDELSELEELQVKINETEFSKEAKEKANAELKKLKSMGSMSAEATVVRGYLDWLLSIPWGVKKEISKDIRAAQKILDDDHYALTRVKDRIIEYIAVQNRTEKLKGPILCFVGPPGVGKTSLGKSVAKATGREFIRISLGGVHDEAEIRGHRRTYIGSMPGKIIQSLKKSNTTNPLMLLDEIDKMGSSLRGDPASAMLEVLDPEQNSTFMDHYLDVEYDLSNIMFITTANFLHNIPEPLKDRMEVISLSGYLEDEKLEIAKRHLIPKQLDSHGIRKSEFRITDPALTEIIRTYTHEAGVRNLEREIAKLSRKAITIIELGDKKRVVVGEKKLEDLLGPKKFRYGIAEESDKVGIVTGLAWTSAGGDLLLIEALKMPGKGRIKTTGRLGNVMKESISAALSYAQSISPTIGVKPTVFEKLDFHVHVPEGATPKDGPSAGIAMVTSIVSVLTGIAVRKDLAMTGEMTLRGNVLPIGGLRSKLLAAIRGGISTVIIPKESAKDLKEVPDEVKSQIEIIQVSHISEVLRLALVKKPVPIEWNEDQDLIIPTQNVRPEVPSPQSSAKH
ncbi:MAG: endopeptidase La [Albidovulum sp.]|nr:endopeptidase La [Albidovulum sp.]